MSKDIVMMETAKLWAKESYCKKQQVGVVIAKNDRVISVGYNGTIPGLENCCEDELESGRLKTKDIVVHAEINAIAFIAKAALSSYRCTLYSTLSPCANCAKVIVQSGISRVVYLEEYKDTTGLFLLEAAGVELCKLTV